MYIHTYIYIYMCVCIYIYIYIYIYTYIHSTKSGIRPINTDSKMMVVGGWPKWVKGSGGYRLPVRINKSWE